MPKPEPSSPPPEKPVTGWPGAYGSRRKISAPGQTFRGLFDQVAFVFAQTRP